MSLAANLPAAVYAFLAVPHKMATMRLDQWHVPVIAVGGEG